MNITNESGRNSARPGPPGLRTHSDAVDSTVIKRHYEDLADNYDEFLYWSPGFVGTLADKIVEMLDLQPDDTLVDIGGGTGMYSLALLERVGLKKPVTVVDPFPEMLRRIPDEAPIIPVAADAVEFSTNAPACSKVLIKEAIHHVDRKPELMSNLYRRLDRRGRVLLVHVDPNLVEYPLFDAALDNARTSFADPDELVDLLEGVGFETRRDELPYRHDVATDRYHRMVEQRYMSILTSLPDEQLIAGLDEMRTRHAGLDSLQFTETFSYVLGTKTP
ncbi:hypothetical protein BH23ACT12_BH23ACT12_11000 [soil metagenome]